MNSNLHVVTAEIVDKIINQYLKELYEIIKNSYLLHEQGGCINAPSSFLFFPHRPEARIIALASAIKPGQKGFNEMAGIKWVASYPNNRLRDLPRASAVILLNHPETGFPIACLEGSLISATRTALSAVLGAEHLYNKNKVCPSLGIIGSGFISKHVVKYLILLGWHIEEINVYDASLTSANSFVQHMQSLGNFRINIYQSTESVIEVSDLIVFATTEKKPYVNDENLFRHNPCVLHLSLRDISPNIILNSINVVDDVEHILTANTSVHLAYKENDELPTFINATIGKVIQEDLNILKEKTIIYSPMGLGILDIAVSQFIYNEARIQGNFIDIERFMPLLN